MRSIDTLLKYNHFYVARIWICWMSMHTSYTDSINYRPIHNSTTDLSKCCLEVIIYASTLYN